MQLAQSGSGTAALNRDQIAYQQVRQHSVQLAKDFTEADQTVQSMPDASPMKWHLAHTSWFFETFLLQPFLPGYTVFNSDFAYLFNSYYNSVGEQYLRANRGLITRPGKSEVIDYRHHVDRYMYTLLADIPETDSSTILQRLQLGLAHEHQHQELLVTDIKHALSFNPCHPSLVAAVDDFAPATPLTWQSVEGGMANIGAQQQGFYFDNEGPRHQVFLYPFQLADRLITNAEYIEFITDGGYQDPLLWLSEGWAWKTHHDIVSPLYWRNIDGQWFEVSLAGLQRLDPHAPVKHVSLFEALAYATWAEARLATEFEWEHAVNALDAVPPSSNAWPWEPSPEQNSSMQFFDVLWQWTNSQYLPYPGFKAQPGAIGEYNGKFMSNQFVLKGGSCATPGGHIRASYRNFFPAHSRWQFSGIRLAKDAQT